MDGIRHLADELKAGSWLAIIVEALQNLGGTANYSEIYPIAKRLRINSGETPTPSYKATIRRTVEDHSKDSDNFRGRHVFSSTHGIGKGTWTLIPKYQQSAGIGLIETHTANAYRQGAEGVAVENTYLRKSRNKGLAEERKKLDDYSCQSCGYRKLIEDNFIIEVHHLHPLGLSDGAVVTSIDDIVCLCPNCHRIAHTGVLEPLSMEQVRLIAFR